MSTLTFVTPRLRLFESNVCIFFAFNAPIAQCTYYNFLAVPAFLDPIAWAISMSKTQTPRKSPPIDLNDKYDKADVVGTLIVVLLKARNLNDKHSFRKSDVFAQAILNGEFTFLYFPLSLIAVWVLNYYFSPRTGTQKRTHIDTKGGQHPEWDGEARFPILKKSGEKFRKMEVSCYSMEPRSEDLMGKGTVDISETLRTGEFDGLFIFSFA